MAERSAGVIIGADTHKLTHHVAIISSVGQRLADKGFEASAQGYRQALQWARTYGEVLRAGIEATGSYGAGLCDYLKKHGIEVYDVYAPDAQKRRMSGKCDTEDAYQAAEAAAGFARCAIAKDKDATLQAARLFEGNYQMVVKQRTASINSLKNAIITCPDKMRQRLGNMPTSELVKTCAALRIPKDAGIKEGYKEALRFLARRIQTLDAEASALKKQIEVYAKALAPTTMSLLGIGCHSAIRLLCAAGQNIQRMKSEPAFSMLCGASPIPASTGNRHHHRLNRGGDRKANCALHTMAITRMRYDKQTQAFIAKKMSEGKSKKDAIRVLKRYLAREVYNALTVDLGKLTLAA